MYEQVFGFTSRPFSATPFVQTYFPAESIHYALSQSRLCIERASGPVVVTGPSGTGKTLLMTMLSEQYEPEFSIVNIVCSNLVERKDLLQHVLFEINLPYREMSEGELRLSLIDFLKSGHSPKMQPMGVLMLVDEAHTLSAELLDELRGITNFVRAGRAAISLVMAGLPSLEGNLIDTKSESFNQRIAARCFLSNLGQKETYEYILTQVERAGGNAETLFTADALSKVFEASDGCPRLINQVCDYALVVAASQNSSRVTNTIVTDAWNDVQSIPTPVCASPGSYSADDTDGGSGHALSEVLPSGDLVIEFGSLEDEPEESDTIEFSTLDQDGQGQNAIDQTELSASGEELVEYQLQDEEPFAKEYADAPLGIEQYDYSIVSTADELSEEPKPREAVADFADPFDESFEAEESVDASYVPFISAQNINSLMVTTDQLALLEAMVDAQASPTEPQAIVENEAQTPVEHSFSVVAEDDVLDTDQPVANEDDLAISKEGLASLDQIQEDIRRLQMDLQFSQQNFASEAVHPDFAIVSADQPIDELLQERSVVVDANGGDVPEAEPIVVVDSGTVTETQAVGEIEVESRVDVDDSGSESQDISLAQAGKKYDDDDRDMMILSQPERFQVPAKMQEEPEMESEVRISTGKACRVEYHDLFRQLRTAN